MSPDDLRQKSYGMSRSESAMFHRNGNLCFRAALKNSSVYTPVFPVSRSFSTRCSFAANDHSGLTAVIFADVFDGFLLQYKLDRIAYLTRIRKLIATAL